MPLTITAGTAWRIGNLNTFTFDATWTLGAIFGYLKITPHIQLRISFATQSMMIGQFVSAMSI